MDILFRIGNADFTPWVKSDTYNVDRADVYQEWTDGNWHDHREVARTRITGSFSLSFARAADFQAFIAALASERNANNYYSVTVFPASVGAVQTIDAFLDYKGSTKWDVTCPRKWQGGTVAVFER